jgi:hypothetical protein
MDVPQTNINDDGVIIMCRKIKIDFHGLQNPGTCERKTSPKTRGVGGLESERLRVWKGA